MTTTGFQSAPVSYSTVAGMISDVDNTMKYRKMLALIGFTICMSLIYHFVFGDMVKDISGDNMYFDSLHFSFVAMWGLVGEQFNIGSRSAKSVILGHTTISMMIIAFM